MTFKLTKKIPARFSSRRVNSFLFMAMLSFLQISPILTILRKWRHVNLKKKTTRKVGKRSDLLFTYVIYDFNAKSCINNVMKN